MSATPVARQTGSTTTNAGTHSVTFSGTPVAGELLLAFVASDGGVILDDSAGVWTKLGGQQRNGVIVTGAVLAKIAEGSDTLTVRTRTGDAAASEMISWVTFRIADHGGIPTAVWANGSSTNSDPPAITPPWGSQDYLFIAARMGDAQVPATAAPSGYSTLTGVTHSSTNGACVHTAEKSAVTTTENPGTFTSATEQWAAVTVAIPPATIKTPMLWGSYEVTTVTSTTASIASPSFTPGDGELLVVKTGSADATCVPSVPTSAGATFSSQAVAGTSGSFGYSRLSTAVIGTSPGAMTITQAFTGSGFVRGMVVERWKNAQLDATPAVAQATGASGAPSTTLTTEAVDSVVTYINNDWQAVAPGAYLYRGTHTNETGLFDVTTTDTCMYWAYQYAPATGSQTLGLSAPAGQNWSIVGIELIYKPPTSTWIDAASATTGNNNSGTPFNTTMPSGTVQDDYLLAFCGTDTDSTTPFVQLTASGWTELTNSSGSGISGADSSPECRIYGKVVPSGETGPYSGAITGGSDGQIIIVRFTNVDTSSPILVGPAWARATPATAIPAPSVSPASAGLLVTFYASMTAGNYSTPSGMEEIADVVHPAAWFSSAVMMENRSSGGATGTRTSTHSASDDYTTASLVLRPVGGSAPVDTTKFFLAAA